MEKIWLESYPEGVPSEINPHEFKSLADLFEQSAQKFGSRNCVTNMGTTLTFEQLERKSKHFAAYCQNELGLEKGDRLAIMLPNTLQYYVALFGALRAGLVVVNINPLYTHHELEHQLNDSGAESILVLENFAHTLEKALPKIKLKNIIISTIGDLFSPFKGALINFVVRYIKRGVPSFSLPNSIQFTDVIDEGATMTFTNVDINFDDTAFLQYTGGTTGPAKGTVLSHGNILANTLQCDVFLQEILDDNPEVLIAPLPLYHIFSLTLCCFVILKIGGEVVLITNPRDLNSLVKTIANTKYTLFAGINVLYNALLHNEKFRKLNFDRLKVSISGGAATSPSVANDWFELTGKQIIQGYGLTEASPVVTLNPLKVKTFSGSIGLPLPSTEVDILDDEGKRVALGDPGELCVKGPQVMQRYWNKPEETANVLSEEGWLKTGDMVTMDEHGFIYIVDRKKDMILVSGFNVYPTEVENVLMSHSGIQEAGVIGVPSEETGEKVKAVIVKADPNLTEEDVIAHCKEYLTNYKRPKLIEFVDELPKTPIGKVLRRKLKDEDEKEEKNA